MSKQDLFEIIQIKKAYMELLKLPIESKERQYLQSSMAKMRDIIAEHEHLDPEEIQLLFETWVRINSNV